MRTRAILPTLAALLGAMSLMSPWQSATAYQAAPSVPAHEGRISIGKASLYVRDIGRGRPIIVVHGGPDFDSGYLLPELDRLADSYRLVYYDQRGRGKSADRVAPEDVTLASDVADLDTVRQHFRLPSVVVLGHSWGAVLALEYVLRYPSRVSQLILMNPAPASARDRAVLRKAYLAMLGADMERQRQIAASAAYKEGDPDATAARYRIHFEHALAQPDDYEKLMAKMKSGFVRQGKAGIVKARAVEDRLMQDSWDKEDFDLMPSLRNVQIPTLIITGDRDFIPVEISEHIAGAVPNARLVTLKGCGHFAYLECPDGVRTAIDEFFRSRGAPQRR